ncbi:Protein APP-1, partial [Aphelenchoides avenae]
MATENPKLVKLRALFADAQVTGHSKPIQAYVLPRTDAHQSEYINDRDNRVQYISGFSGSNAYTAPKELEPGWTLMKQGQPDSVEPVDWITDNVPPSSSVGFDPSLFGYSDGKSLIQKLTNARIEPVPIAKNLVDAIWNSRPPEEIHTLIALKQSEHGEASSAKIERVREKLRKKKCDAIILTALDDIAWLFNVRGADIPYNPLFFSVAAVTLDSVFLFMDERKLDDEVRPELQLAKILPYEAAVDWLRKYHAEMVEKYPESHKIWVPNNTNYYIGSVVNEKYAYVDTCPVALMKAIKNEVELAGMRYSHVRDSAAHVQFLVWLRREVELGHIVDEARAEKQIDYYRSRLPGYVSLSFPTISAADEHAAQPHYHMTEESGKKVVTKDSVYLVDSGGHYR